MARVPITVMGYKCERCEHEWVPRDFEREPLVCPKCKSAYWDRPRRKLMPYEEFQEKVKEALTNAGHSLTWTEVRTATGLPQKYPNNRWVRRLEKDIGLQRDRDEHGRVHWELSK